jgi:hypothetical protein
MEVSGRHVRTRAIIRDTVLPFAPNRLGIKEGDQRLASPASENPRDALERTLETPKWRQAPRRRGRPRLPAEVRAKRLDWLLIVNRRHLERVLCVYVDHYNRERPHRALELRPPEPDERREGALEGEIRRRDHFGGLIHEYYRAAA